MRRRRGRARTQRQIAQAGVECIGAAGSHADVEVIELASRALIASGLASHRIELNLTPLTSALLDRVDPDARAEARIALAQKDGATLDRLLEGATRDVQRRMRAALDLIGGHEVIAQARRVFDDPRSRTRLDTLDEIFALLESLELGVPIGFDLGEPRGFGYYTGASFAILAEGPGEPVAVGGRYDELLGRFGHPLPATGVAIDLDHLDWALGSRAPSAAAPPTVVLAGTFQPTLAATLRAAGVAVAALPGASLDEAKHYASVWCHHAVVLVGRTHATVHVEGREPERMLTGALGTHLERGQDVRRLRRGATRTKE